MLWDIATPIITAFGFGYITMLGIEYLRGKTLREKTFIIGCMCGTILLICGLYLLVYIQNMG